MVSVQTISHFQEELDKDFPYPLIPLSPFLFILAVELLACKIRQDKEIQGINIFQREFKISQFADDTTLLNKNTNSVRRAITVLDNFGDISGLRLNPSKTKALWLGPWRHCKEKPFGFKWPKEPVRVLGTYISYDEKQNEKYNFKAKLQKLQTVLDIWNCRNLTIFGRCLIVKSLGISQLFYMISNLNISNDYIHAVNSAIFKFIWRKKKDKIKRKSYDLRLCQRRYTRTQYRCHGKVVEPSMDFEIFT